MTRANGRAPENDNENENENERAIDLAGHPGLAITPRAAKAVLVLAHGAGAGMTHAFLATLAHGLADRAVATIRWNMPFMAAGKKRVDPATVAERACREVWAAAAAWLPALPHFAGGKSFGGRMTSRAHAVEPFADLRGLVFFGFPLHRPEKPAIERAAHLAAAGGPMLFVQGTRDDLAGLPLLRPVIAGLGPRATLHVVEHADHGFDVLVRSGRTPAEVSGEIADAASSWMIENASR